MNEEFPGTLYDEFITIQKLDSFFNDKELVLDDEFYSEDYKNFLEEEKRESAIISEEELEEIEEDEMEVVSFTQEEVMIRIVDDLNIYSEIYQVPPVEISNKEWDNFFNQTFTYYDNHKFICFYDEDMIMLNRLAIARSMLYQKSALELEDYKESIRYIDSRVLYQNNKEELIETIKEEDRKNKVIPIQKYLTRKQ